MARCGVQQSGGHRCGGAERQYLQGALAMRRRAAARHALERHPEAEFVGARREQGGISGDREAGRDVAGGERKAQIGSDACRFARRDDHGRPVAAGRSRHRRQLR